MRGNLLAACALVATVAAAPACAADLVTNGGFETGDLSGWTITGNTAFTGVDSGTVHSGSFAGFFGQVGSTGTLSQSLSTVAGQAYTVSFWLQNDGGTPSSFDAAFGADDLTSTTNPAAFDYTFYSFNVTASSASTLLAFTFRQDPAYFHLDDISVEPAGVPEPATWAMMILGLGAAGFALRRARPRNQAIA